VARPCLGWLAALLLVGPAAGADEPGAAEFEANCLLCHGADLTGVDGLGANLAASAFVAGRSEAELVEFLKVGRMPGDPASLTGRAMPGFAWLPADELRRIAAFVKSRHAP